MLLIFLTLWISSSNAAPDPHPEWVHSARKLIGENEATRNEALKKLNEKFSDVDDLLAELEGPYRPYALDTIVAMAPKGAADELLKRVNSDRDGGMTLAVNALLDQENYQRIASYYVSYLEDLSKLSTPTIVAMVDFLTHIKRPCSKDLCTNLLSHSRLEVQQAGALHLAAVPVAGKHEFLLGFFPKLYPQVRTQVMLTLFMDGKKKEAQELCKNDQDAILQSACEGIVFEPLPKKPLAAKKEKPKTKPKPKSKSKTKAKK